jgi:hypothetical protein
MIASHPGEMIDTVYFLEEGICSIVVTMDSGIPGATDLWACLPCWAPVDRRIEPISRCRDTVSL